MAAEDDDERRCRVSNFGQFDSKGRRRAFCPNTGRRFPGAFKLSVVL